MTDYVWYPITGTGTSTSDELTWNTGTYLWNTGSFWINSDVLSFNGEPITPGTVPGSGTDGSSGPGGDSVGLVAGSLSPLGLSFYDEFYAGQHGDPYIASSDLSVDMLLNAGTVELANLLLAGFGYEATAQYPTLDVEGADLIVDGTIANQDTVDLPSAISSSPETVTGGGTIELGSGATVEAVSTVQSEIMLNFKDSDGDLLKLDGITPTDLVAFAGTITNFSVGDTIWLPNIAASYDSVPTVASYIDNELTITIGDPESITIDLSGLGLTSTSSVGVNANANGGIDLVTCFAAGTRIATPLGDVPVEDLRAGDLVEVLLGGPPQPVVWVGYRHLECRRHPTPKRAWPIRIRAGAFGPGRPYRDLLLSPDHAVYANDVLIPVKRLVNGSTIDQVMVDEIDYYHVELPRHNVLLANGLAAESFLDVNGNRGFFANGGVPVVLHPDLTALAWAANGCAPLVVTGPAFNAVREQVNALAHAAQIAVA